MQLVCQVEVVNRGYSDANMSTNKKYLKSTLALGREPYPCEDFFLIHFSSANKSGYKYKILDIKQVFVKCLNEGKVTIRFREPPQDLFIRSEVIQLKYFLRILKACITADEGISETCSIGSYLSSISVVPADIAPVKMIIQSRNDIPMKGFPRTIEYLSMTDLKLCNFRRDILLLSHLLVLDLSKNEIEKLPVEFGRMKNLRELYLSRNRLGLNGDVDWRWLFGPQIIKTLKLLDISHNKIKCMPNEIWKLENLVTLNIRNNELVTLPAAIGRIQSLRYLDMSKNKLESLPCSLLQCKLEQLDLSLNKFHLFSVEENQYNPYLSPKTAWDDYIFSLTNLAAKATLKNKLFYAPNIIPLTLVQFLDDAKMCFCGDPVVNKAYIIGEVVLSNYFDVVCYDNKSSVKFECYFCSAKCFDKYC